MKDEQSGSVPRLPPGLRDLPELSRHARRADEWPAPRLVPTSYPGAAPDYHHLLVGDHVLPIEVQAKGSSLDAKLPDGSPVDEVLTRIGEVPLAERVPVLAYGANRSPQSLVVKFAHHHLHEHCGQAAAVPVLTVTVPDIDVVGAGLSSQGYIYADMAPSSGTRTSAMLTLLDRDQAVAIHASKGVGHGLYNCALLPDVEVGDTSFLLTAVAYAGCMPVFVSPVTGSPLAFSAIAASGRRLAAFEQVEMFTHVLESTGVVGTVAGLLGGLDPTDAEASTVAKESARLLNGQWWYRHNTGDTPTAAASQAQRIIRKMLGQHGASESTSQRLAAAGQVLDPQVAYASGPELCLGAQLTIC